MQLLYISPHYFQFSLFSLGGGGGFTTGQANVGSKCQAIADCRSGLVCQAGACASPSTGDCLANQDCASDQICLLSQCAAKTGSTAAAPIITGIQGDLDAGNRIRSVVTVLGSNLQGVSAVRLLTKALDPVADLLIGTADAASITATLPATLAPGDYVISVSTPGGAARQDVTLLKGEAGPQGLQGATGSQGPAGMGSLTLPATFTQSSATPLLKITQQGTGTNAVALSASTTGQDARSIVAEVSGNAAVGVYSEVLTGTGTGVLVLANGTSGSTAMRAFSVNGSGMKTQSIFGDALTVDGKANLSMAKLDIFVRNTAAGLGAGSTAIYCTDSGLIGGAAQGVPLTGGCIGGATTSFGVVNQGSTLPATGTTTTFYGGGYLCGFSGTGNGFQFAQVICLNAKSN